MTKPRINATGFGSLTVDGRKIRGDVIMRSDGSVHKRKKKLSKRIYGTSHTISLDEVKHVYEDGAELLIIGTGKFDSVRLSQEASTYLEERDCRTRLAATPDAIHIWNEAVGKIIGLFHVTC